MKIYIAGKVSGEKMAECTMKFGEAYQLVRLLGADAVNPLALVNDWHVTWQFAMKKCIKALMDCDAIYVLPCWKESNGAKLEIELAEKLGIPVFFGSHSIKMHLSESYRRMSEKTVNS